MKIYIAGASCEIDMIETFRDKLIAAGHEITHDWCKVVREHGGGNPAGATLEQMMLWAMSDLRGVLSADIVWLVMPPKGRSWGSGVEFGAAIGARRVHAIVSGPWLDSIFCALAQIRFANHEDALAWLTDPTCNPV